MTWKVLRKKIEKSIVWHITYANVLTLAFLLVNFFLLLFFSGLFEDYGGKYDYIQDLIYHYADQKRKFKHTPSFQRLRKGRSETGASFVIPLEVNHEKRDNTHAHI